MWLGILVPSYNPILASSALCLSRQMAKCMQPTEMGQSCMELHILDLRIFSLLMAAGGGDLIAPRWRCPLPTMGGGVGARLLQAAGLCCPCHSPGVCAGAGRGLRRGHPCRRHTWTPQGCHSPCERAFLSWKETLVFSIVLNMVNVKKKN